MQNSNTRGTFYLKLALLFWPMINNHMKTN